MNRTARTIAASLTTIVASVGVILAGAPAEAAGPAPTTAFRIAYHAPGEGYFFSAADRSNITAQPKAVEIAKCGSNVDCRDNVNRFYGDLNDLWKSYNAEIWAAADGLPSCASLADDGCVFNDGTTVFTVVRVNGASYFVQTSTKPAPVALLRERHGRR